MTITITPKELIKIVNEKFNSNVEITQVDIELPTSKYGRGVIFISEEEWFVTDDVKKVLKEKNESVTE